MRHLCLFAALLLPGSLVHAETLLDTGFKTTYTISRNEMHLGRVEKLLLIKPGNQLELVTQTHAEGLISLFLSTVIYEHSLLRQIDTGIAPLRYTYQEEKNGKKSITTLNFDWDNKLLTLGNGQAIALTAATQDVQSFLLTLMVGLQRGQDRFSLDIADRKRSPTTLQREAEETLTTRLGTHRTVRLQEVPGNNDYRYTLWCAPELDFLPFRIRKTERDGDIVEMELIKLQPGLTQTSH